MKKVILIQARTSSSRLSNKVLNKIGDISLLEYVHKRCLNSKLTDKIYVITSNDNSDDKLVDLCKEKNIKILRGDLNNVLKRFIDTSNTLKLDNNTIICRVCADSPFVDTQIIDKMFSEIEKNPFIEYIRPLNLLNGFASEVFTLKALKNIIKYQLNSQHKEHVTLFIKENKDKFNVIELNFNLKPKHLKEFTLTVDYKDDLIIANKISNKLQNFSFTSNCIIKILNKLKAEL